MLNVQLCQLRLNKLNPLQALILFFSITLLTPTTVTAASENEFADDSWDEIVAAAKGGEVNWFMWGGSDDINRYVSDFVGGLLKKRYDITLNRVGINDTVEAVNLVLGEKEAGNTDSGSVDLIWINGENFRSMKQGDMAFCGYLDAMPNNALIDWENDSIANDFGVPVDGCEVPWSKAQFAFAYDEKRTDTPPTTIAALIDWVTKNPGRFTYPAPPDFSGSVFVRHVFYHAAGGVKNLLVDFDQALFDEVAAKTWQILNDMKPALWRAGRTYPQSITQLDQMFANSEVDITFSYDPSSVGLKIENGSYPATTKGFVMTDGTIGNTSYTLIPFNSPNKAAAIVLQNLLTSDEAQYQKALPEVWGTMPAIDLSRISDEYKDKFNTLERHPSVVSEAELAEVALPELQSSWITAIEEGWKENVAR